VTRQLLRATIFHTPANPFQSEKALCAIPDGALLLANGRIEACGEYGAVAKEYPDAAVRDLRGGFLLPGFIDTHVHYPQVRVLGGLGYTLLDWLEHRTLPEEARFSDAGYACTVAREFIQALASNGTTTALVFGSHFAGATATLLETAATRGLRVISGLVLSDRLLLPELHQTPDDAYTQSKALLARFPSTYAVTPRFALSTTPQMLQVCAALLKEHPEAHFQTHINENQREIDEVLRHFPSAVDYLGVYEDYGLIGRRSVLAHNVHTTDSQLRRIASRDASVSHCPASNAALGSGIFPMRRHLDAGVRFALGTDVGGGTGFGLLKEGLQAYLMQRVAAGGIQLDAAQLLYLATRAGAEALALENETGDFREGKSADYVYLKPLPQTPLAAVIANADSSGDMLAALFTLAGPECVAEVIVAGRNVLSASS
jgi:guanine deaminase